jgi:glycosyltransferase involved in cell wall biosynthesis
MNILHLRASNFYGGPERQLHFHAREARGSGYHVTVASFSEHGNRPEYLDVIAADGIDTHVFTVSSAYDTRAISDLRLYLTTRKIDLLCTHDYRTTVLGCLAIRHTRTRWLAFSRGFTRDNFKVRLYHTIDKFLIRQADHIVAVSGAQKDKLKRLFIRDRNITVVTNAIDPDSLANCEPIDLRQRFGFDPDTIVCISGGRFSREKGQRYLIDAATEAVSRMPRLRFVLFGDGPDLEKMRRTVADRGMQDTILCPGFERNLLGCMRTADILINPSLSEGLPNIVLEAMALRVPVVATAVGGVPEIITDNVTGRLVAPKDADQLAEVIIDTAEHIEASRERSQQALEFITAEYSFKGQFEKLARVYDMLGTRY